MTNQKEAIVKAPAGRKRRTPLMRRNVLNYEDKDPNFVYRFVNDTPGRVQEFLEMGYEHVDHGKVGESRVDKRSADGSRTQVHVGKGEQGFLMRIPKEFYDEDQKVKQEYVDATETSTKREALDGTYGKLELTHSRR